jgi:acetoin:2,6-dichlorophenolindophenol oxidoreductase subunit alpha
MITSELAITEYAADRQTLNIELYRQLYLVRAAEAGIRRYYHEDDMKTPMHMSMGEEAIHVGVCQALGSNSDAFGTYRSHALYLAKTGETDRFFAEMYGKETGLAAGKAGSMHMSSPEHGLLCSAAIVASTIPLAVGAAWANKVMETGRPTAVFFGDGAVDAGVFWESLNNACLFKVPCVFVCEDNDFAVHTYRHQRHGFRSITQVAAQYDCIVAESDTTDVEEIYRITAHALEEMRRTERPVFLYFQWYRYLEHVGINEDFDAGYRSREEYLKWYARDPVSMQRLKLLHEQWLSEPEIAAIENAIEAQVELSVARAKEARFAPPQELYRGVFA